ncbi:MAG TPA: hypothetical protein VFM44_03325 [Gemmatimonadota bacterium]|nr:hypothetical protein [Gemmatimonadota bacterium]
MRTFFVILLAATSVLSAMGACDRTSETEQAGARVETTPGPDVRALTDGLAMWRADGFTMLVPDDADIVPTDPTAPATWAVIVAGPGFVREVDGLRQPGPPAYRLDAATYAKPDTVALEDWVAARLGERGEGGGEAGITVPLAGESALRTGSAPGLAGSASYWLERNGKVVELKLDEEPESPLSGIQRHIQSLMLSTFRWSVESVESEESGESTEAR